MSTVHGWNTNWPLFAHELERALQGGASNADLAEMFGGQQIQWTGTIEQINFNELRAVVDVALQPHTVGLPNGEIVILDGLTLAVAESDASNWEGYKRGDKVTFRAVLGEPQTPFSAIELKTLKSGRSIIMLRVGNAMPAN